MSHFVCLTRKKMERRQSPNAPRQSSSSVSHSKNAHRHGQRSTQPAHFGDRLQTPLALPSPGGPGHRGTERAHARDPQVAPTFTQRRPSPSPRPRPLPPPPPPPRLHSAGIPCDVTCFRAAAPAPPRRPLTWGPARHRPADGKRCPYMGADSGGAGRQLSASPTPRASSGQFPGRDKGEPVWREDLAFPPRGTVGAPGRMAFPPRRNLPASSLFGFLSLLSAVRDSKADADVIGALRSLILPSP